MVYTSAVRQPATIIRNDTHVIDYKLFWVACKNIEEANYLLAIINSDSLYESVKQFMSKGQFGARDLQKHLWKLPIPEFDPNNKLHASISDAGKKPPRARRHACRNSTTSATE